MIKSKGIRIDKNGRIKRDKRFKPENVFYKCDPLPKSAGKALEGSRLNDRDLNLPG